MLDIYDENMTHLGVKERGAVHRDGDWHRVFHCWVIYRDAAGQDFMVLQKRGPDKDIFPNRLDVTVGGHYEAGESMAEGVREIEEELGITARFDDLIPVGVRVTVARYEGLIDREFADNFLLVRDTAIGDYPYQQDEVSGLVALNIDETLALFAGERETIHAEAVGLGTSPVEISLEHFIPLVDRPFYKALVLAKRCLNGEKHLVI
ncbi:MAG TPA: NUDIX domain-containing protein [Spirillospora sp.]|nr:NUDIX domain-containing protein [Spirillospora sp.]